MLFEQIKRIKAWHFQQKFKIKYQILNFYLFFTLISRASLSYVHKIQAELSLLRPTVEKQHKRGYYIGL